MTATLPPAEPTDPPRTPAVESQGTKRSGITFEVIAMLAFVLALGAALLAVFSLALSARSIDESRRAPAGGGGDGGAVTVTLTEFAIAPETLSVDSGASLSVANDGSVPHDLVVEGVATPELQPGESATLTLADLEDGTYTMYCAIAGHREAGMEGEITIG